MYWVLEEPQQQVVLRLTPSEFDGDRWAWAITLMQAHWSRGEKSKARPTRKPPRRNTRRPKAKWPTTRSET